MWKRAEITRLRASALSALALTGLLAITSVSDSPVADAAQREDLEEVRGLLSGGADVNAAQGDGMTALHWAAVNGHAEMTEILLYAGAHVQATTRLGAYTPLHLASRNGHVDVIEKLVAAGSDVDGFTTTGVAPLHLLAASGRADGVRFLIEQGADVNVTDFTAGRSPLVFATAQNRLEVVEVLIAAGADVSVATNVTDFVLRAEVDREAERRRDELMALSRDAEAAAQAAREGRNYSLVPNPDEQDEEEAEDKEAEKESEEEEGEEEAKEDEEEEDEEEAAPARPTTPQPRALSFNDLVGRQGGMTALHYAARDGHVEIARTLLEAGANINRLTLGDQSSPLVVAAINGHYDLAMDLLETGANPILASEDGVTPLYATLNNRWAPKALYPQPTAFKQQKTSYLELMDALLLKGADPNVRLNTHIWYTSFNFDLLGVNFSGATPFWRAAYATDVPAMKLLIAHGADPNIPTAVPPGRRRTRPGQEDPSGLLPAEIGGPAVYPIHAASGVGYGTSRAGNAHRHAPDGWLPSVQYLVEELEADVNARDKDGYSAVHHAAARGDNELIEYLVEKGADVTFVSRRGQTTVDMANGPQQRVQPFPETIALLEGLGAKNNHNCQSCE